MKRKVSEILPTILDFAEEARTSTFGTRASLFTAFSTRGSFHQQHQCHFNERKTNTAPQLSITANQQRQQTLRVLPLPGSNISNRAVWTSILVINNKHAVMNSTAGIYAAPSQ